MVTNRIQFFKTAAATSVVEWLSTQSGLTPTHLRELMSLGAVYLEKERLLQDQALPEGQTLRLHREPKRYAGAHLDWKSRVVGEMPDFFVVNKPAGVPVHATLDNLTENMLYQLSVIFREKLYPAHRLDTETSGLCVVARAPHFQTEFHRLLKRRDTEKIYEAVTLHSPPLGLHRHYMHKQERPPHLIFDEDSEERKSCELEVLSVEKLGAHTKARLRLLTGRTHQIRAQMAHLNCPLTGDRIYGQGVPGRFRLHARELHFVYAEKRHDYICAPEWANPLAD